MGITELQARKFIFDKENRDGTPKRGASKW